MPDFKHEQALIDLYGASVAGVDEVGYGAWAGPVLVCAVILDISHINQELLDALDDSKKLNKKQREKIHDLLITSPGVKFTIETSSSQYIDLKNILVATHDAMIRAVNTLDPTCVLVDGINKPKFQIPCQTLVNGDQKSYSIAAASIIAKVTRDSLMKKLHEQFPHYGWDTNVGYGTKKHQDGLKTHGITDFHRKSYKPIQPHAHQ
jgi:ribonuclease HII